MTHHWQLPEDLTASAFARESVRTTLSSSGVTGEMLDDAALIASELAANAVRYGQPPYTLRLDSTEDHVRITVSNHGPAADPQPLKAAVDSPHGRGLTIIASLSADMGWGRDGDRLDVWADLPAAPPPG